MTRSVTIPAEDGAHAGVDEESYHADPTSLSVSGAKLLLPPSCPAKFRHIRDHGQPPKQVWDFGTVAHRLVLGEGAQFVVLDPNIVGLKKDGTVADSPRATTGWKQAEADARRNGLTPISLGEFRDAEAMASAIHTHPVAGDLFTNGQAELALYRRDPETGVRLRGRLDWLRDDGVIVDYKTSATANPADLGRLFWKLSYHMQAAWYLDLVTNLGIADTPRFLFVVQEKTPPYPVTVAELDDIAITEGRRLNRQAIDLYADLCERDEWPTYTTETVTITLPAWALKALDSTDSAAAELINQLQEIA